MPALAADALEACEGGTGEDRGGIGAERCLAGVPRSPAHAPGGQGPSSLICQPSGWTMEVLGLIASVLIIWGGQAGSRGLGRQRGESGHKGRAPPSGVTFLDTFIRLDSDGHPHQSGNESMVFKSHTHRAEVIPVMLLTGTCCREKLASSGWSEVIWEWHNMYR